MRPSPIPPRLISLDASRQPKNLNSFVKSPADIPIPVSNTLAFRFPPEKSSATVIDPLNVNFTALPRRLKKTYFRRFTSLSIVRGRLSSRRILRERPFYSN